MKRTYMICAVLCFLLATVALFASCNKDGDADAGEQHTHDYQVVWTMNETHHWRPCKDKSCTEAAGKAEHAYGEWVNHDDYQHHKRCACGATKKENHIWDEGVLGEPATPGAAAELLYTCTGCGATKTRATE